MLIQVQSLAKNFNFTDCLSLLNYNYYAIGCDNQGEVDIERQGEESRQALIETSALLFDTIFDTKVIFNSTFYCELNI